MRVYFINPPAPDGVKVVREGRCMQRRGAWTSVWSPLSLALCAAVLEKEGIECKLTDCIVENISFNDIKVKIMEFEPDLVVLNTATPSIESDLKVADDIRSVSPNTKTIAIGIHVTALPQESFNISAGLDYIVRGEPEFTVRDIAIGKPECDIAGLVWRKNGKIVYNEPRQWIENLDELPFPAWHLADKTKYRMPFTGKQFLLVATSRGCPHNCVFCADHTYYGKKLRLRSPEKLVDELEWIGNEFGIFDFLFWAESFTINRKFVLQVSKEIIERGLNIRWVCNSRVDNVDYELLNIIKQAGCWMIGYGIESGNQETLDRMHKNVTPGQTKVAVELAHKVGIEVTGHCMLGFPGETEKTIKDTIKFVKSLSLDFAQFYCAVPFPGSELYNIAKEKCWINTHQWKFFEQNFSVLDTPALRAEKTMLLRKKAFVNFYLRPEIIYKTVRKFYGSQGVINFVKMGSDFLSWVR